jgi:glucokinase
VRVLAVDIGGTNVRAAVIAEPSTGAVIDVRHMPKRSASRSLTVESLIRFLDSLLDEQGTADGIESVGVSIAGVVDASNQVVRRALNVGWKSVPLGALITRRYGVPCVVDSDSFCGARAEGHFGAGAGVQSFLFVTVGTGIGHAVVVDGRVIRGSRGAASVFGHLCVVPGGALCYCGNRGCLCQYASGEGITRVAVLRAPQEMVGQTAEHVLASARTGIPWAIDVLADASDLLARGLSYAFNTLDIESVVLGGGVVSDTWPDLVALQRLVEETTHPEIRPIIVRRAVTGPNAMLLGAALAASTIDKEE